MSDVNVNSNSNPFDKKRKKTINEITPNEEIGKLSDKTDDGELVDTSLPGPRVFKREEILPVIDALMNHGYAIDSFMLGKIPVSLRTRFSWEEHFIYKYMEESGSKTTFLYQKEFNDMLIASALVKFGSTVYEPLNGGAEDVLKASMLERYNFVKSLNSVFSDILSTKLRDFDDKQKYVVANFEKLLEDF